MGRDQMRVHKHIAGAFSCLLGTVAAFAGAVPAKAQSYPSRTITIVVPFPGGGTADLVPRILADGMAATLGATGKV